MICKVRLLALLLGALVSAVLWSLWPFLVTLWVLAVIALRYTIVHILRTSRVLPPETFTWFPKEGEACEHRWFLEAWIWCEIKSVSPHGDNMYRIRYISEEKQMLETFTHLRNLRPLQPGTVPGKLMA